MQEILVFFDKYAVQIFAAIFVIFIVALFIVLLSRHVLKRKEAIVLESSAYYHKVESLNDRYSFKKDIFDDGCFDYNYVFDTKQKYDRYSVKDIMDILLQEKLQVFEQAIKDVDINKNEYKKYCAEFEKLHSEITLEYIVGKNTQVLLAETTMNLKRYIMTVRFAKWLKLHGNVRHIVLLRNIDGDWSAVGLQQKYVTK